MTSITDPDGAIMPAMPPFRSEGNGPWVITRHADASLILRSPAFRMASPLQRVERIAERARRDYSDLLALMEQTLLFQDGPPHLANRQTVRRIVQQGMARWPAPAILAEARRIAASVPSGGPIDAVEHLADPLPSLILASMLGLPVDQAMALRADAMVVTRAWSHTCSLRDYEGCQNAAKRLRTALRIVASDDDAERDDAAFDLIAFLLVAGADSIAGTISAALDLLAHNPAWQARLRSEPTLMPGFIRETLRLAGPLRRLNRRVAQASVDIGDVSIAAGDLVLLRIDSAHRDAEAFADPDQIDTGRRNAPLLAFGGGAHMCQGPLLGAMEAEMMVTAIIDRFQIRPTAARGALLDHEDWRVFAHLPLILTPVAAEQ
ncbi:cytochrome P450 [Sphingobium sp. MK2]|uniref:cytochrome P450 n=1 Tax=Sphingobium sp. MK2 TaxID=3116540 RepID=UPI0032E36028